MANNCILCGGELLNKIVSRNFKGKKVHGIKAFVCNKCGEVYVSSEEAKRIEKAVTDSNG